MPVTEHVQFDTHHQVTFHDETESARLSCRFSSSPGMPVVVQFAGRFRSVFLSRVALSSRRDGATVVLIIFFALVSSPALQRNQHGSIGSSIDINCLLLQHAIHSSSLDEEA